MCQHKEKAITAYSFLTGGGEMGQLTRSKDWALTPIGSPGSWPQSLKTTLSIVLHSKFPMFLWWGPELICFYNDAYRPSLGENGKHPGILGIPAKEAWPEIWDIIKPLIDTVLNGGEATWSEDQLIPIFRNGSIEDVYWTFSYSPVNDETGKVAGVLVTCSETTEKVRLVNELKQKEEQYNFVINAAELATWDLDPKINRFTGNNLMKEWFGLTGDEAFDLAAAINNISVNDRQKVIDAISNALQPNNGSHYEVDFNISLPGQPSRQLVSKGKAVFDKHNNVTRFSGITEDITEKYAAAKKAAVNESRFRNTIKQAPIGITILTGADFIAEAANDFYLEVVGRTAEQFIGKSLFDSIPEVKEYVKDLLTSVLTTGIPYHGTDFPVTLNRYGKKETAYFNFTYHPYRELDGEITGVIVIAMEVTESVKGKHALSESERQFRNMVMQSPIAMTIFRGEQHIIEMANKVMFEKIWRKKEEDAIGKPVLEVFPELLDQKYPELLQQVYTTGCIHREVESVAYVQWDDGLKKFYLDFEYRPLHEPDGSISGIIITVNDVTEKVEARLKAEESEKRLNIVINAGELGTWEWAIQDDGMKYSEKFLEILGFEKHAHPTHEELLKRLHPDDMAVREAAFKEAFQTGSLHYETRVIWNNNSLHSIQVKGKVFFDKDNQPALLIGTVRDVTEEKHYQQELEDRERRFRLLANAMPQLVWTGDARGNLNYFNQSVYNYSGLPEQEVEEKGWLAITHTDDREESIEAWQYAVSTGTDFIFEHRFLRADGQYRWQLSRAIPQKDAEGNIRMWVGTSTDIQEIKEVDEQKDLFIGMASHELKTPVTTVKGYVQLLQSMYEDGADEFLKDSLATIDRQIINLTSLISDLLDLSKIKSGSLHLGKEYFDINEMVQEIITNTKQVNPLHTIDFSGVENKKVYGDKDRLGQVLINFLTNAIKYAPDSKTIKVRTLADGDNVIVSVEDSGIGINKNDQQKIFERFYRVEGKNEKTFPGFGIGLFIAAEIIRKHNGSIGVSSQQGKGSTFYFSIPIIHNQ